ncbi:enolase-like domain-containing protein [Halocalculus aciditolerans]|uniref:hypothetical protein n=1 Tax=Halocalculus aciditolerans TaxID=1383812 RepID=UPI001E4B7D15|nr:hypothetical protein [Halocalculus aciditolerans]
MHTYGVLADRPLTVETWATEQRRMDTSSGFERVTTTFAATGDGATGRGEDVTYDADDHAAVAAAVEAHRDVGAALDLPTGEFTLDSFSDALDDAALWPDPPSRADFRNYRRWAVESAALDLALKQADESLASALDREYAAVRFAVSTRLPDDPPTAKRVEAWLDVDPTLEFKLDPTPDWSDDLVRELAALDAVRVVDLKSYYEGTDVDNPVDLGFYRRVLDGFPDAVVEDAAFTPGTEDLLRANADRLSFDAPVHSVADVKALPVDPEVLNVKPSRFGTLEALFDFLDYAEREGIALYGGGQFELGVGREHLHALASLFYPDGPNDVAPVGYNAPEPTPGLPASPLRPPESPKGLAWPSGD